MTPAENHKSRSILIVVLMYCITLGADAVDLYESFFRIRRIGEKVENPESRVLIMNQMRPMTHLMEAKFNWDSL